MSLDAYIYAVFGSELCMSTLFGAFAMYKYSTCPTEKPSDNVIRSSDVKQVSEKPELGTRTFRYTGTKNCIRSRSRPITRFHLFRSRRAPVPPERRIPHCGVVPSAEMSILKNASGGERWHKLETKCLVLHCTMRALRFCIGIWLFNVAKGYERRKE